MKNKRTKIWIDRFQTQLFIRITLYVVLYQVVVSAVFYLSSSIFQALNLTFSQTPGSLLLLSGVVMVGLASVFVYDAIKFSHRIVGPLYRFHKSINTIIAGEDSEPMMLRKDDYLQDLKNDFNEMLRILEQRGAIVLKKPEPRKDAQPHSVPGQQNADKALVANH